MTAEAFLDSNILIYTFDDIVPKKQRIAQERVRAAFRDGSGVISYRWSSKTLFNRSNKVAVRAVPHCSEYQI
jgi:predicted nucleic acid-binding protein